MTEREIRRAIFRRPRIKRWGEVFSAILNGMIVSAGRAGQGYRRRYRQLLSRLSN